VEAQVEALLAIVDEDSPVNFRPCDVSKEIQSLKLGIPNECLPQLSRRTLGRFTHLFNHCPAPLKEAKTTSIILPKPGKDRKFPKKLGPISLLSTMGKLSEKLILR
jgi:hypothetical protein